MKRRIMSLILFVSIIAFTSANVYAAGANAFTFTETYTQKVLCSSSYGYCDIFNFGKFNIAVKLSLEGKDIDLSQIDGDTEFYLEVGNYYLDLFLGDGQYIPGKTSKATSKANFVLSDYDWVTDKDNVQYIWINLSWNSKTLTVKIKALTGTPDIEYPIIAYDYLYEDSGTYSDDLAGYVSFGKTEWAFNVPSTIKVKQSTKKDKYKSLWDLGSVSSKGKGYEVPVE